MFDVQRAERLDAGQATEHVTGVRQRPVLECDPDPFVGRGDPGHRPDQGVRTAFARPAQPGHQPRDADLDHGAAQQERLDLLEGADQRRRLESAGPVVLVHPHDQRIQAGAEHIDAAEMTRDLGVRLTPGFQQDLIDLCVREPFGRLVGQGVAIEPREALLERVVHAALAGPVTGQRHLAPGGHDQVVPPESADRLARALLDGRPVGVLDVVLLGRRQPHQHVVVDEFVIPQRLAGRVEALEDLLCVGVRGQADRDVLELAQTAPDVRRLGRADLTAEERVVVVERRDRVAAVFCPVRLGRTRVAAAGHERAERLLGRAFGPRRTRGQAEDHALEHLRPGLMRSQFGARPIATRPHQQVFDLADQGSIRLRAGLQGVLNRRGQQHQGGDALLTVDQHQLTQTVRSGITAGHRQDRPEKMRMTVVPPGHGPDIGEQLLAPPDVPPVLPLVDRHHDGRVGGGQPGHGVHRAGGDVGGHIGRSARVDAHRPLILVGNGGRVALLAPGNR